jgi:aminoglycoside phosphotransferase (APT) family kinase protein
VPDRLAAAGWLDGDTLVHGDLRADNLLLGPEGSVAFVDWAWAVRGADWVDPVLFALDASAQGGVDPEWLVGRSPLVAAADPREVTDLVLATAGMYARSMRNPPPRGLPTLRAFQRAFHAAALAWGARRADAGLV